MITKAPVAFAAGAPDRIFEACVVTGNSAVHRSGGRMVVTFHGGWGNGGLSMLTTMVDGDSRVLVQ